MPKHKDMDQEQIRAAMSQPDFRKRYEESVERWENRTQTRTFEKQVAETERITEKDLVVRINARDEPDS